MKRWWMALAAALLLLGSAAGAFAQQGQPGTEGEVKTKFYNFDDMLIDGEIKKPSGLFTNVRDQVKFQRLLSLKKSFLPKLKSTAKEQAFK
ncbi:MAG: hypothetical protein FJ125_06795 [Deltaproteobacteria bacterium]|nr:hypothetical protein [Deltaproteobacteria bacterium]